MMSLTLGIQFPLPLDPLSTQAAAPAPAHDLAGIRGVQRGLSPSEAPTTWQLDTFCGRLAEVSGDRASSALTLVFRLVQEAQIRHEPTAWITMKDSVFFPPDVAASGIDLESLAVIWISSTMQAARTADHLLRSGAYGLLVLDLGLNARLPMHAQTRLAGLAHKHESALICITTKESRHPSLGSLVSLRAQTERTRRQGDHYPCEVRIIKDKRRGPGWTHKEVFHGPDGMC